MRKMWICADVSVKQENNPKSNPCFYTVREEREGFTRLDDKLSAELPRLERIPNKVTDQFLIYFTSGTTGNPKMAVHNYSLSFGAYRHGGILAVCPE